MKRYNHKYFILCYQIIEVSNLASSIFRIISSPRYAQNIWQIQKRKTKRNFLFITLTHQSLTFYLLNFKLLFELVKMPITMNYESPLHIHPVPKPKKHQALPTFENPYKKN